MVISAKGYIFYWEKSLGLSSSEMILYGWRCETYLANRQVQVRGRRISGGEAEKGAGSSRTANGSRTFFTPRIFSNWTVFHFCLCVSIDRFTHAVN